MPVMDEFKEERAEMKNRSFKEKCSYFWDYYKWHVIGGAVGIFIICSMVYSIASHKPTAFYAVFLNTAVESQKQADAYKEGFCELAGIDLQKNSVYFDTDMHLDLSTMDDASVSTSEKMMVYIAAGDLDVMISDITGMDRYSYNKVMTDFRNFLTPEEIEKYQPEYYYMDRALLEKAEAGDDNVPLPDDPTDPSTMTDPIPVGIRVTEYPGLTNHYLYGGERYFCVFANSSNIDKAHLFLDYLWRE